MLLEPVADPVGRPRAREPPDLLAAVVFGGMQSLVGPLVTAFLLVAMPEVLRFLTDWRLVIYGVLFVVVMIYRPQGLFGYREMKFDWFWHLVARFRNRKQISANEDES